MYFIQNYSINLRHSWNRSPVQLKKQKVSGANDVFPETNTLEEHKGTPRYVIRPL